jgi:hypothetical protein
VSTAHRRCRSSLSQPDVDGCGRNVAERILKTTSVPKTKKKDELPMKLSDDPKILTARRNPRRWHHSHKLLEVAIEMGLKPRKPYWKRHHRHHLNIAPPNLNPKNSKTEPPPPDGGQHPPSSMARRTQNRDAAVPTGDEKNLIAWDSPSQGQRGIVYESVLD